MGDLLGYARVSTTGQELAGQRQRLNAAAVIRIFEDVISGKDFQRPGLSALLEFARPGDLVCVVRLDRLGRSLRDLLETVQALKDRGIGLVSLEERIDTSSAAGELIFHVFGAIAHFERRLICERTKDGLAAARSRGQRLGRPNVPEDKLAAAMLLIEGGLRPADAARQLSLGRSTVYRAWQRRATALERPSDG